MLRYRVGDTVKIRADLEVGDVYRDFWVAPKMHNLCGKIAHITEITKEGAYRIDLLPHFYFWIDEMFEDIDTEV